MLLLKHIKGEDNVDEDDDDIVDVIITTTFYEVLSIHTQRQKSETSFLRLAILETLTAVPHNALLSICIQFKNIIPVENKSKMSKSRFCISFHFFFIYSSK